MKKTTIKFLIGIIFIVLATIGVVYYISRPKAPDSIVNWLDDLKNGKSEILSDKTALKYLSDSIDSISVIDSYKTGDKVNYNISVNYTPYKSIKSLKLDIKRLKKLRTSYINGDIGDKKLSSEIEKIYKDEMISNCFTKDTKSKEVVLVLSENNNEGVTHASQVNFVNCLLTDSNIISNIKVFEDNIEYDVKNYLVTP